MEKITSTLRLRMSAKDAHYGGELVDGAHMVHLFGDVATELLIKLDGDEGLFCAYDSVEFLAPTYAGDYIEAYGEIDKIGIASRILRKVDDIAVCEFTNRDVVRHKLVQDIIRAYEAAERRQNSDKTERSDRKGTRKH